MTDHNRMASNCVHQFARSTSDQKCTNPLCLYENPTDPTTTHAVEVATDDGLCSICTATLPPSRTPKAATHHGSDLHGRKWRACRRHHQMLTAWTMLELNDSETQTSAPWDHLQASADLMDEEVGHPTEIGRTLRQRANALQRAAQRQTTPTAPTVPGQNLDSATKIAAAALRHHAAVGGWHGDPDPATTAAYAVLDALATHQHVVLELPQPDEDTYGRQARFGDRRRWEACGDRKTGSVYFEDTASGDDRSLRATVVLDYTLPLIAAAIHAGRGDNE